MVNCVYIVTDSKKENKKEYFRYTDMQILSGFSIERFIEALKRGYIDIDFDARTGHNHGTRFRINRDKRSFLYEKADVL